MKAGSEKKVPQLASSWLGEDRGEKKCGGSGAISSFDSDPSGTGARKVRGRGMGLDCRRINFRGRATLSRLRAGVGRLRTRPSATASAAEGSDIVRRDNPLSPAVLAAALSRRFPPTALRTTLPVSPALFGSPGDGCSQPMPTPIGAPPTASATAAASASAPSLKAAALDIASGSPDSRALMSSKPARATAASPPPSPSPPSPPLPPLPPPPLLLLTGLVGLMGSTVGLSVTPLSYKSWTDSCGGVSWGWRVCDEEP
ncbi:hypothetical protein Vretimale_4347 [Volvox reticuliferus]|uniref:Uncharacterized protein n=1 Tax=Volvox reticuliferus TaxID=1737510 RepID=A0A8J4DC13_9CHLO|nr:hypothetical protein Vretimale_4347 [Volvox reticuliferus]